MILVTDSAETAPFQNFGFRFLKTDVAKWLSTTSCTANRIAATAIRIRYIYCRFDFRRLSLAVVVPVDTEYCSGYHGGDAQQPSPGCLLLFRLFRRHHLNYRCWRGRRRGSGRRRIWCDLTTGAFLS